MTRAFDPDPNLKWLFCFAHPDDEVAVGAWIRRLSAQGGEVWLSWTHDTPIRRAEALGAARLLQVPDERCTFLGASDGRVVEEMGRLQPAFRSLMEKVRPDRVCTLAFEQGHLDHDATNLLVNVSFDGPVLEYPMYHPYTVAIQTLNEFADPSGEEVLDLTLEERRFKAELLRRYPSQTIRRNVFWYGIYRRLLLRPVYLDRLERMRVQTHFDFLRPNLPPKMADRVRRSAQWRRWVEHVEPFLAEESESRIRRWQA